VVGFFKLEVVVVPPAEECWRDLVFGLALAFGLAELPVISRRLKRAGRVSAWKDWGGGSGIVIGMCAFVCICMGMLLFIGAGGC
jgi:hypothetical protein